MNSIHAVWLLAAFLSIVLLVLFRRLLRRPRFDFPDPNWLEEFTVTRYRPMERLLSEEDYRFLASQRGYDPSIGRRLRAERRRIFLAYLRNLIRDFNRLSALGRVALVSSAYDRPELALMLLRQRALFYYAVVGVYARLGLYTLGWGTVSVSGLVRAVEDLQVQVLDWTQAPAAA